MAAASNSSRANSGRALRLRPALAVFAMLGGAAIALSPTILSLESYWREIYDYHYGYLIAAVALAWLIQRRGALNACALQQSAGAALILAGALLAWLVAFSGSILLAEQLLLPVVLWLAVWAGAGAAAARLVAAPLAYLYFAIPVWELLVPFLQRMTVLAVETSMGIAGVPTVVRDIQVSIPEGTFLIIEGCSGKKYLLAGLAIAVLGAGLNGLGRRRGLALVAIAAGLALLGNWVRVIAVITAGHLTGMQHYLVAVEHRTFGDAIWLILLAAILVIARRLAPPESASGAPSAVATAPAAAAPQRLTGALLVVGLCAVTGAVAYWNRARSAPEPRLAPLPIAALDWQGPLPASSLWQPRFDGAADDRRGAYASVAGTVQIYINVYGEQRPGHKLLYFANTLLGPGEWRKLGSTGRVESAASPRGRRPTVETAADPDGNLWIIGHLYYVGPRSTGSALVAQIMYGASAVVAPQTAGVLAVAARCADRNCTSARELVEVFWSRLGAPLGALVREAERSGERDR
jgi:EpsI family protein